MIFKAWKPALPLVKRLNSAANVYKFVSVKKTDDHVYELILNNPAKKNCFTLESLNELKQAFDYLNNESKCNVIVLHGNGDVFSSGMDLNELSSLLKSIHVTPNYAESCLNLRETILNLQSFFQDINKVVQKPCISIVHGACIGAGLALATATDIRYCTPKSYFQIKEILMGFPSDLGILQRMPTLMGSGHDSFFREIALTGRVFTGIEAADHGLCQIIPHLRTLDGIKSISDAEAKHQTYEHCINLARSIARLNPFAVQGTKLNLNKARNTSTPSMTDLLEYAATLNMAILRDPKMSEYARAGMTPTKSPIK